MSFEAEGVNEHGLRPFVVLEGPARVTEGGAPALLQRLAYRYLGPEVTFPPMSDPPDGFVTRSAVSSVGGMGPWNR